MVLAFSKWFFFNFLKTCEETPSINEDLGLSYSVRCIVVLFIYFYIRKVNTSIRRLTDFGEKLEDSMERFSGAIEEADNKEEMNKLKAESDKMLNFMAEIMERTEELSLVEKILRERKLNLEKAESTTDEKIQH